MIHVEGIHLLLQVQVLGVEIPEGTRLGITPALAPEHCIWSLHPLISEGQKSAPSHLAGWTWARLELGCDSIYPREYLVRREKPLDPAMLH